MQPADPLGSARYSGTVTSWAKSTAWGFISCPDLQSFYAKDIFFHQKDCGGATISKGQKVTFLLDDTNASGKPQARAVRGAQDQPDPPDAPRYNGTVHSFSATSAWGFISCPELAATFGKDIFFHIKDCGGAAAVEKGQTVSFLLDDKAVPTKPQARSIRVLMDPGRAGESRYRGTITNYSVNTAWGFIACPELAAVYGKDIFFHQKDCGGQPVSNGSVVTFELDQAVDGRPQARNVRPEGGHAAITAAGVAGAVAQVLAALGGFAPQPRQPQQQQQQLQQQPQQWRQPVQVAPASFGGAACGRAPPPAVHAGGFLGGCAGGARVPQQQQLVQQGGDPAMLYSGSVQSFSSQAGWGFIECPALGLAPGKGVFFHTKDFAGLPGVPAQKGDAVTFALGQGPSGRPQAIQVSYAGDVGGGTLSAAALASAAADFGSPVAAAAWPEAPGAAGTGVLTQEDLNRAIAMALEGPAKRQRLF